MVYRVCGINLRTLRRQSSSDPSPRRSAIHAPDFFPLLLLFLNSISLLHLDKRKPIVSVSSNGQTAPRSPSFSRALRWPPSPLSVPTFCASDPHDSDHSATQDSARLPTGRLQKWHRFARRTLQRATRPGSALGSYVRFPQSFRDCPQSPHLRWQRLLVVLAPFFEGDHSVVAERGQTSPPAPGSGTGCAALQWFA
jgi:hypothetical protein